MPAVSVVIASYESTAVIEACLSSLQHQCSRAAAEVIVVDSGTDDAAAKVAKGFPWVELLRSPTRLYPGAARNLGASKATGRVLAFIDADCVAAPDWIDRIREAHRSGEAAVIGGAILIREPRGVRDWAAYLCSFHLWTPLSAPGPMKDIPTCNLSYDRTIFEQLGPFREYGYSSDTELNWKVAGAGRPLVFDPALRVRHGHHPSLRSFLRRQFVRGRAFGAMRVREFSGSWMGRWIRALGSPLVPFVLVLRLAARTTGDDRRCSDPEAAECSRAFWKSLPLILAGFGFWAAGEALSYVRLPEAR